ncbi:MAG: branched-chain amino acid ABC transporter permease [Thermoanaerobacteraceae bacterium]|nr:branched-chain amino acid ABC transporter permease [Thermoanaerobacteraceae bacterium]
MEVTQIIIQVLNSISYGLLLFLLAAGLSLIFGLMGVINLAYGSFFMLGVYLSLAVIEQTGSFILALLGAATAVSLVSMVMEVCFIRKIYNRELDQVLLTFGFAYIFMDIVRWCWGGTPQSLPKPVMLQGSISILGAIFPVYRLAVIFVGILLALVLWLIVEKTRMGVIIKAGVDDKEMVSGLGINIRLYFTLIFALGAFLAAVGGVLGGPITGAYLGLDSEILVLALAVVVIGGLGTLKGAFLGSVLIGFMETFGNAFFPNYAMMTIYITMVAVLVLKPNGLLGKDERP